MEEFSSREVSNRLAVDKLFEHYEEAFSDLLARLVLRDYSVVEEQLALMRELEKVARDILGRNDSVFTIKAVRNDHEQA